MSRVLLQCSSAATNGPCGFCQQETQAPPGRQLCAEETGRPICEACARKHAPELLALLRLGDSAERVGRIAAHGIFPPMASLLELAHAAEEFRQISGARTERAA